MELEELRLECEHCATEAILREVPWRCAACGGPLKLRYPALPVDAAPSGEGVWRYRHWLPNVRPVSLGEPTTPLATYTLNGQSVTLKLEGAQPSGSFKDRGSAVAVSVLRSLDIAGVADDSSGNAGASLAAYSTRADMRCAIYAPASTSPSKLKQVKAYGAELVSVPGPRSEATQAARRMGGSEFVYVPHAWSPLHLLGTRTFAFELWEQLGRMAPDAVVLPVGAGTLMMGLYIGFAELKEVGLVDYLPRLYGIQAQSCAPLMHQGPPDARPECLPSMAEGILVGPPPRERSLRSSVNETGGRFAAVDEGEILAAYEASARSGFFIERTSAVALAGAGQLLEAGELSGDGGTVVAITGNGLKTA